MNDIYLQENTADDKHYMPVLQPTAIILKSFHAEAMNVI